MISAEAQKQIDLRWEKRQAPKLERAASRAAWTQEALDTPLPEGTHFEPVVLGGVPSERVIHPKHEPGAGIFLLLHGGGYVSGNCITHRKMASLLSEATGLEVYVPDYRLAPEHPFPAAVDDALAAYVALLEMGADPARLVIGGDSAGGGLSAALMLALKQKDLPLPICAVLMSPWTDILARGPSYEANTAIDPAINPDDLRSAGRDYAGNSDPLNPLVSPIEGDLSGLPRLLIQVGGDETMLDDSTVYAERAKAAGVDVTLEVWPGLWHVWQGEAPHVPEAVAAYEVIGKFVRAGLAGSDKIVRT